MAAPDQSYFVRRQHTRTRTISRNKFDQQAATWNVSVWAADSLDLIDWLVGWNGDRDMLWLEDEFLIEPCRLRTFLRHPIFPEKTLSTSLWEYQSLNFKKLYLLYSSRTNIPPFWVKHLRIFSNLTKYYLVSSKKGRSGFSYFENFQEGGCSD